MPPRNRHTHNGHGVGRAMPKGLLATPAWLLVRFYQIAISPIIHLLPNSGCRFYPTCSEYTLIAIQKHGAIKGCIMGAFRIMRCNPLCEGGLDFVPEKFALRGLLRRNPIPPPEAADAQKKFSADVKKD